jgi:hypothetical protein
VGLQFIKFKFWNLGRGSGGFFFNDAYFKYSLSESSSFFLSRYHGGKYYNNRLLYDRTFKTFAYISAEEENVVGWRNAHAAELPADSMN